MVSLWTLPLFPSCEVLVFFDYIKLLCGFPLDFSSDCLSELPLFSSCWWKNLSWMPSHDFQPVDWSLFTLPRATVLNQPSAHVFVHTFLLTSSSIRFCNCIAATRWWISRNPCPRLLPLVCDLPLYCFMLYYHYLQRLLSWSETKAACFLSLPWYVRWCGCIWRWQVLCRDHSQVLFSWHSIILTSLEGSVGGTFSVWFYHQSRRTK